MLAAMCCQLGHLLLRSLQAQEIIKCNCCVVDACMKDPDCKTDSPFGGIEAACEWPHTQDAEHNEGNDTNGSVDAECRRQGHARDSCSSKRIGRVPSAAAAAVETGVA
jgi:hypothetical protein